jgi:hypothetical protein
MYEDCTKTIILTEQDDWIKTQIKAGHYIDDSRNILLMKMARCLVLSS